MKFLLTSSGLTNTEIIDGLFEMVSKEQKNINVAYIPTALNMAHTPDKRWAIENLKILDTLEIGIIDIVDFSAIPRDIWLPRLEQADVWFVEGGNPFHLLSEMKRVGFDEMIKKYDDKIYVGSSAGSMILGKVIVKNDKDNNDGYRCENGLGLVDFSIRPHAYQADKLHFTNELLSSLAKKHQSDFYVIDDNSAVVVEGDKVSVVSIGKWEKINFEK